MGPRTAGDGRYPGGDVTRDLLAGIRVLDFTRVLSGPHCTRLLADFGADVVKVEGPDQDPTRAWGRREGNVRAYFAQQNAGKRSVGLDLGAAAARDLCRRLAASADVVVENFRPGVMDRLGLGWDRLSADDDRLIYASITGYGRERSRAGRKAYANMVAAQSGLIDRQTRMGGTRPGPLPFNVADSAAGLELFGGIAAALYHRERTGRGQRVEVSMLHTLLSIDDMVSLELWDPDRPLLDTGQVIRTSDGHVAISPPGLIFRHVVKIMDRADLLVDERFRNLERGDPHQDELLDEIERWSRELATEVVVDRLSSAGIACEPVVSTAEAIDREHSEPDSVIEIVEGGPGHPSMPVVGTPIRLSATPPRAREIPVWKGQHNHDVLRDWLADDDTVDADELERSGALLIHETKQRTP